MRGREAAPTPVSTIVYETERPTEPAPSWSRAKRANSVVALRVATESESRRNPSQREVTIKTKKARVFRLVASSNCCTKRCRAPNARIVASPCTLSPKRSNTGLRVVCTACQHLTTRMRAGVGCGAPTHRLHALHVTGCLEVEAAEKDEEYDQRNHRNDHLGRKGGQRSV